MLDCIKIIERFCSNSTPLYGVLVGHSSQVTDMAVAIARWLTARGEVVDTDFVAQAAMLHDIGIVGVDAPSIHCHGSEPYICHGVLGRQMLEQLGLPRHALVCERHTGAGITVDDIVSQLLPLPHRDMIPVTIEEQIVCFADKFFSKNHVGEPPRDLATARSKLARFGEATLRRFDTMCERFVGALSLTPEKDKP